MNHASGTAAANAKASALVCNCIFCLQTFNLAQRQHEPEQEARGFEIANKLWLVFEHDALRSRFEAFA
jgi:hypothetical protein